jgi:valyl-tRNA synthetase
MIMAGYEFMGKMPFRNVYFTGIVRDKLGRKMSKSLGNSPDPLLLIDKYGADGVRMGMMLSAPAGNDILFDETLCEQGRNFNNKIWNAFRLVQGWSVTDQPQPEVCETAVKWFDAILKQTAAEVDDLFTKYRLSEALMAIYRLFWDEFSAWYLEMIKPAYQQPIDRKTYDATLRFFDGLLKLLHPFMPFITEELWQHLYDRKNGESIMVAQLDIKKPKTEDEKLINAINAVKEIVAGVRAIRNQKNIAPKELLTLQVIGDESLKKFEPVIMKMANVSAINVVSTKDDGAATFMVGTTEYAVPIGNLIDVDAEIAKAEAELKHLQGFLIGIQKKLANESFVSHAPEAVVAMERKKQDDTEQKINTIVETLKALRK